MKYLWSIIAGITMVLYRHWFGLCLVLSVLAIGFKSDIVQLIREDRIAEQQRIDHERTVELERIKANAIVEAKRLELQAEENKRAEEKRMQEEKERQKRATVEVERQRIAKRVQEEKERKKLEATEAERHSVEKLQHRYDWLVDSINHARKYNLNVVEYDNGSSRTVESLMYEKKKIEEENTGKIMVKYTLEPQVTSAASQQRSKLHSAIDQKINEAKCKALKKEISTALYCVENPRGWNKEELCETKGTIIWEQIVKASYNQILNNCQSNR